MSATWSLREAIRTAILMHQTMVVHYGKSVEIVLTTRGGMSRPSLNHTANLWYRTHYPNGPTSLEHV